MILQATVYMAYLLSLPVTGVILHFNLSPFQGNPEEMKQVISYSYDQEKIDPYRYRVFLDEVNMDVDFAPSFQSALYSITFGNKAPNYLIFNTRNGELIAEGNSVSGFQYVDQKTRIYIYAETNRFPERQVRL